MYSGTQMSNKQRNPLHDAVMVGSDVYSWTKLQHALLGHLHKKQQHGCEHVHKVLNRFKNKATRWRLMALFAFTCALDLPTCFFWKRNWRFRLLTSIVSKSICRYRLMGWKRQSRTHVMQHDGHNPSGVFRSTLK